MIISSSEHALPRKPSPILQAFLKRSPYNHTIITGDTPSVKHRRSIQTRMKVDVRGSPVRHKALLGKQVATGLFE